MDKKTQESEKKTKIIVHESDFNILKQTKEVAWEDVNNDLGGKEERVLVLKLGSEEFLLAEARKNYDEVRDEDANQIETEQSGLETPDKKFEKRSYLLVEVVEKEDNNQVLPATILAVTILCAILLALRSIGKRIKKKK